MPFTTAPLSPFERVLAVAAGAAAPLFPIDVVAFDGLVELGWEPTLEHESLTGPCLMQPAVPQPADLPDEAAAPGLSLEQAAGVLVAEVEAPEADRARLDGRLVAAYAALHTVIGEQHAAHQAQLPDGWPRENPAEAAVSVEQLVIHEVATATAVPAAEASRRLRLATRPRRHRALHERLEAGTVSLLHATLIAGQARDLPDAAVEPLVRRVLAPMRDGSRPTHPVIVARLCRVVAAHAPADAGERRADALARRSAYGSIEPDGTGVITITSSAERTVAILERIESLARALRAAGDPRTLDQLRSDLATDGLLGHAYGPCPEHAADPTGEPAAAPADGSRDGEPAAAPAGEPRDGEPGAGADLLSPCRPVRLDPIPDRDGQPGPCPCAPTGPPATVWIVVPFEVATGASDAACEIPGHGWVTAEHARAVITAPGSLWRWLAVDALTGQALHLATDRYRPTPAMLEQVRALDGHCRGPGCQVPAHRCDLDHHLPHPDGETSTGNLGPLQWAHHNLKTGRYWSCVPTDDHATTRALHWRTLAARDYLTHPKNYREALDDPPPPPRPTPPPPPDEPPF